MEVGSKPWPVPRNQPLLGTFSRGDCQKRRIRAIVPPEMLKEVLLVPTSGCAWSILGCRCDVSLQDLVAIAGGHLDCMGHFFGGVYMPSCCDLQAGMED